jgi:hypothetical protein
LIDKKDVGFNLKPTADKTFAFTNLQTFVTLRPGEKASYASVTKKEVAKSFKLKKGINKVAEIKEAKAISLRFLDVQDKQTDTIDVLIPLAGAPKASMENSRPIARNDKRSFSQIETSGTESGLALLAVNQEGYNTQCVNLATGDDFYKLRKKMASESNDDRMITELKKAAKNKCFTTVQIKNLASLFLTDNGKYKFFRAAYPLVYDFIQYPSLEKELTEAAVIQQFRSAFH